MQDLELSVIVGDYKGKVKMYSFIGACHLKLNDYEKAAENYNLSLKMSTDALDTFFALLGLLELSSYNYDKVSVDEIKDSLADVLKNNTLPDFCATELKSIIDKHPQQELLRKEFRSLLSLKDE